MSGLILVKSAKNDLLQKLENLTQNWNFRLKSVQKNPNFRVIGLIKVIPAPISSDWSYKSHFRKNDLLQSSRNIRVKNFRVIGLIAVIPAQIFFRVIGLIATHDSGLKATHVSGLITSSPCKLHRLSGGIIIFSNVSVRVNNV